MEYLRAMRGENVKLRDNYKRAAELARKQFLNRICILREGKILDRTLIIFTSDHGEVLNEYGSMSHFFPICPESGYVATVFIGPEIPKEQEGNGIIRQVDILPTPIDLLGFDMNWQAEGINVFQNDRRLCGFVRV